MTTFEISNTRLINQKIKSTEFTSAKDLVSWMGAMQSQDFTMAKWAIGNRLVHSINEMVETAFNKGEILRSHLMRPTWHFVSADDIYWMNELSAPKIKSLMKTRHQGLELTESVILKSERIFEKALLKGEHLTREEMAGALNKENIKLVSHQLYHLLFLAELDGIICSGKIKEGKQTFALLSERVPHKRMLFRDESLAELARRYFTSRSPVTLADFIWWSGLSITDAKKGFEMVKSTFISETIESKIYWMTHQFSNSINHENSVHLLPAFDEFLISYRDRSASLSLADNPKAVSSNGIFYPVIVVNGQVIGVWKRIFKKDKVRVLTHFFQSPDALTKSLIKEEANRLGRFLNKNTEIDL